MGLGEGKAGHNKRATWRKRLDALRLDARYDEAIADSLASGAPVSENVVEAHEEGLTLGQRAADAVARFGGSWPFIGLFAAVLVGWMAINSVALLSAKPFDPYPFILLNLVLSCLAAVQAPIIMMSQRRQDERDRLAAENDYRVNLKAELEVREMREALDRLHAEHGELLADVKREIAMLRDERAAGGDAA